MALVRENTATKNDETLGTVGASLTGFNLNCGTNGDRFAFVRVGFENTNVHIITGVTIDGNAMTSLGAKVVVNFQAVHGWYYINPGTGNRSVVVTHDGGNGGAARACNIHAAAYSGAHQTTPTSGYATGSGLPSTDADVTVVSAVGSLVLGAFAGNHGTWTTDDAGATELADTTVSGSGGNSGTMSERPGAESVAMQHTPPTNRWAGFGFSLAPSAAAATSGAGVDSEGAPMSVSRSRPNVSVFACSMAKAARKAIGDFRPSGGLWLPEAYAR